jgi:hypothetical protein
MDRRKSDKAPATLRSRLALPPAAAELAAKVLEQGAGEQWERSLVAILIVHERRCPGVPRTRASAAQVIDDVLPPNTTRAA